MQRCSALMLGVGALGGLAPDIDFCDAPFGARDPGLSYLLYHRGHTHTLVGCFLLALVIVLPLWLLPSVRPKVGRLFGVAFLAALLHLLMDSTNDYGVHPFWPLHNGWFYGDFIFLLEPLIIICLLPLTLSGLLQDWGSRAKNLTLLAVAAAIPLFVLGLVWVRFLEEEWVSLFAAFLVTAWLAAHLVAALTLKRRALLAWGSLLAVWAAFFVGSRFAKASAHETLMAHAPGERVVQLGTTPAAANPFCWRVVSAAFNPTTQTVVTRMGVVSLLPSLMPPSRCRTATPNGGEFFELTPAGLAWNDPGWHWLGYIATPLSDFVATKHERVAEARRFLRTPVMQNVGGRTVLGDLRLDYEPDLAHYCKYELPAAPDPSEFRRVPWQAPFFDSALLGAEGAR
jgi:inner membrane protein